MAWLTITGTLFPSLAEFFTELHTAVEHGEYSGPRTR